MGWNQELKYGLLENGSSENLLLIHGFMNPQAILKALQTSHAVCNGRSIVDEASGRCCPLSSQCLPALSTEIRSAGGSMNDFISVRGKEVKNPECPLRQKIFGNFDGELKEPGTYADDGFFATAVPPKVSP